MADFKAKMHQIVCRLGLFIVSSTGEGEKGGEGEVRGPPAFPLHPQPLHSR